MRSIELKKKQPEFNTHYDVDTIEYRFKFYDTDEREMSKQIIKLLTDRLPKLRLYGVD